MKTSKQDQVAAVTKALLGPFEVGGFVEIVRGTSKRPPQNIGAIGRIKQIVKHGCDCDDCADFFGQRNYLVGTNGVDSYYGEHHLEHWFKENNK